MTDEHCSPDTELMPCPFCGAAAERFDDHDTGSFNEGMSCIQCTKCGASSAMHGDRKENLVSSWNERALGAAQQPGLREALQSIADWRNVNISGEYEHGLRDIIRSITDCAAAALEALAPQPTLEARGRCDCPYDGCDPCEYCRAKSPALDPATVEALNIGRKEIERQLHKCRNDRDAKYFEEAIAVIDRALASPAPSGEAATVETVPVAEIFSALHVHSPSCDPAWSDDNSDYCLEWDFPNGGTLWIDFCETNIRMLWRKDKASKVFTRILAANDGPVSSTDGTSR